MPTEKAAQRNRRSLIEQDPHGLRRGECAAGGVFQHRAGLLQRDARKKRHYLADRHAVFKILEQCRDGHARAAEHPRSTHSLGVALYSRTG